MTGTVKTVNLPFSFNSLLSKVKNFDSTKTDLLTRKEKVLQSGQLYSQSALNPAKRLFSCLRVSDKEKTANT